MKRFGILLLLCLLCLGVCAACSGQEQVEGEIIAHDIQRRAVGQRPSVPLHQSPHPQSPDRALFQIDRGGGNYRV